MKIAVCIPPARCDCYGHLTRYAEQIACIGAARGMATELLHYTDPGFMPRLFANLADEECIVHFHSFLYDLRVLASPAAHSMSHVLEGSRARTLATVSDHPFTDFMQEMVRNAHASTRFVVVDKTFPDEMAFINPALKEARFSHLPYVPPVSFDETRVTEFSSRPHDLLLPIFLVDLTNRSFKKLLADTPPSWLTRAAAATYEIARGDFTQNPFHVFAKCVSAELCGATLDDLRIHKPKVVPALLNTIGSIDGLIRQERRHKMVRSLLRSVGDLKVTVLSDPIPTLNVDEKVSFVGMRSTAETTGLMANSKAILNCNPTYPSNIHERVAVGMLNESCVITDLNPCIEETFSPGQFVPYGPGFTATVRDIFDTYDVEGIARASAATIRSNPAFSWDAHFDGLMELAHA